MPIVWKVSFEEPLIKLIQSGQISNSKKLIDAIALQYDTCIKQGLPNPPATAGGPLLVGNVTLFKKSLTAFYKLEAAKQQSLVVAIYTKKVKDLLQTIKETYKFISENKKQLRSISNEQVKTARQLKNLKRLNTLDAKRQTANLNIKNTKLIAAKIEVQVFIQDKLKFITDFITPKIQALKAELKSFVQKILIPTLQSSKLKLIKSLPKLIKNVISEIREKKALYLDKIKENVDRINELSKTLKLLKGSITKEDAAKLKPIINTLIKSASVAILMKNANLIISIISKYGDDKINPKVKASCRSSVIKIIKLKMDILAIKEDAKGFLLAKLRERKSDLIAAIAPKPGPGKSRIQESRDRAKQLKLFVSEYKKLLVKLNETKKLVPRVKREYAKVKSLKETDKYVPDEVLAQLLDKQSLGQGSKYLEITSVSAVKAFLFAAVIGAIASNSELTNLKDKYKNNISEVRKKILEQRTNPKEIIFNSFLRLAVLGYWTNATWTLAGLTTTVTFPGVVSLPVSLKTTSNPANFVKSLSKTLQLHTATISGIHIIPGSPPVTLPWVGYK